MGTFGSTPRVRCRPGWCEPLMGCGRARRIEAAGRTEVVRVVDPEEGSSRPWAAAGEAADRVFWDVSCKPRGPLGWVSSHWVMPAMSKPMYQVLDDARRLSPEDELLEVACGSGVFLAEHAGQARRVAGVDVSRIQVELARKRLGERIEAGAAQVILGDAGELPWPDGSFSVATSMAACDLFPDPGRVLAEVVRVVRPRGRVVLTMGQRVAPGEQTHQVMGFWVWAEDDVRRMVGAGGPHQRHHPVRPRLWNRPCGEGACQTRRIGRYGPSTGSRDQAVAADGRGGARPPPLGCRRGRGCGGERQSARRSRRRDFGSRRCLRLDPAYRSAVSVVRSGRCRSAAP